MLAILMRIVNHQVSHIPVAYIASADDEQLAVYDRAGGECLMVPLLSQLLAAGIPKEWKILQVGRTRTRMIDEHFGRWISEFEAYLNSVPGERPPKPVHFVAALGAFQ